jgi:gliding motility-associated-like protein
LANGHFLFYGKLFSDLTNRVIKKDHFGVVEFDATFNLVTAYSIRSALRTNYYNNQIHFDASGKGLITVFEYIDSYASHVFFGAFQNQQFQHQRKAHYSNVVMPGNNGFAFLPNNGYAYLQTYFLNTPGPNSYIEFRKMHNSDTSSQCLGKDTLLLEFSPLNIMEDSAYSFLDPNEPNKIVASTNTFRQTDTLSSTNQNGCKQINFCDRLKINGTFSLCGTTSSLTFTASKNSACGAIVQWDIDRTAIDSLRVISDSSVTVWFRNSNWQGKLYAMVPAGSCLAPVIDSVVLSITRGQIPVNLGLDKSICPGNTIVLNAGKGYASYRWQDGTTDSTYTVTKPGLYYVTTTDACGGIYKDSVLITATAPIPFDAGPDRAKCNSDTLRLTAPGGFLNYAWSNNYNISSTTTQTVTVNPLVDTAYYVRAEKSPGCFAYDTVRVKVYHSPSINLGADRSFCLGDSAVFNAGAGFQTYAWSNGQVSAGIVAKTAGNYSVMATTAEGCRSLDTVRVQQVYTLPQPGLNKNPALCAGESRTLNPGSFAAYKWSNGSAGPSLTVNAAGTYAVTVTDGNGCKASDTTRIATIHPLPQGFLPADTAICSYGSLELKSLADYSRYTWSNGAVVKAITITLPGIYGLEVMDSRGCRGKDTVVVYTKDCLSGFYMPTAFSPNGDGKNDLLRPLLFGNVKSYRFTVYNRWGEVIYQATELQKGWNGKVAGVLQDNSVFVWTCTYQLEGEGVKHEKGTVTLVR